MLQSHQKKLIYWISVIRKGDMNLIENRIKVETLERCIDMINYECGSYMNNNIEQEALNG